MVAKRSLIPTNQALKIHPNLAEAYTNRGVGITGCQVTAIASVYQRRSQLPLFVR